MSLYVTANIALPAQVKVGDIVFFGYTGANSLPFCPAVVTSVTTTGINGLDIHTGNPEQPLNPVVQSTDLPYDLSTAGDPNALTAGSWMFRP